MIRLHFNIDPEVLNMMSGSLRQISEATLQGKTRRWHTPEDDPELQLLWLNELRAKLESDVEALLKVIKRPTFGQGEIRLQEDVADAVLRSCSAIRMYLREYQLKDMTDAELEVCDLAPNGLPDELRSAYLMYLFLAALQNLILEAVGLEIEVDEE